MWCQQQCSEGEACLANFNVHGPNDIRPLFSSCIPVLTDSCLNTRYMMIIIMENTVTIIIHKFEHQISVSKQL